MPHSCLMPVVFFGHGSPMNAIADNSFNDALAQFGQQVPRPKAILVVSAHWYIPATKITAMERPKTIHDFYGFPKELFAIQYPAPGDPILAKKISEKVPTIQLDEAEWGLDHGTWSILRHIFPIADIPVLQLSIDKTKPAEFHYNMGKKLSFLREQGVLLVGSGNIVHNLKLIDGKVEAKSPAWAVAFDSWAKEKLEEKNFNAFVVDQFENEAGHWSVPSPDHYLPLLYILGAARAEDSLRFVYEGMQNATISMRSFFLS